MNENEWLNCKDPTPVQEFLRGKVSDRKLRLFAVACCRRIFHLFTNDCCYTVVKTAEAYADGEIGEERLRTVGDDAEDLYEDANSNVLNPDYPDPQRAAIEEATAMAVFWLSHVVDHSDYIAEVTVEVMRQTNGTEKAERHYQTNLLRCIFGNPFRPISINPTWLTPTVLTLAQAAYDERTLPSGELDPARLAVLSDALGEAGCDHEDILHHLREPGPHVRGCWAIDLVLGKE